MTAEFWRIDIYKEYFELLLKKIKKRGIGDWGGAVSAFDFEFDG